MEELVTSGRAIRIVSVVFNGERGGGRFMRMSQTKKFWISGLLGIGFFLVMNGLVWGQCTPFSPNDDGIHSGKYIPRGSGIQNYNDAADWYAAHQYGGCDNPVNDYVKMDY